MNHQQNTAVRDALGRPLQDLRISLTDRCNFRCRYCMPREKFGPDYKFLSVDETLTIDEILRVTRTLVNLGVSKVRLTGGEPLLRRDIVDLVSAIASMHGVEDLALTTNGSLLTPRRASALAEAGLRRVTISLDATREDIFQAINDVAFPVKRILAAVEAAQNAGLEPVKINMVVRRGLNDAEILPMVEQFRGTGVVLRFIEYMDVGNSNGWQLQDVVSAAEIRDTISARYPLRPLAPTTPGEVATRYEFLDGQGEVGFIHSVTTPFCTGCSRLRLTAEGELFTCLFAAGGLPLREHLREGIGDAELQALIETRWKKRTDRYSQLRSEETVSLPRVEMSRIGG